MDFIDINDLAQTDYNITNIFAMCQHWKEGEVFDNLLYSPRPLSALLFFNNCHAEYTTCDGKKLTAHTNDILYIPQSACYKTKFQQTGTDDTNVILIEFTTLNKEFKPFIFHKEITVINSDSDIYKEYFNEVMRLYMSPLQRIAEIKSIIYKMLSQISYCNRIENIYSNKFSSISKGIIYLEGNVKYDKTMAEIAEMCHVSQSCFRKLFKQYSGKSPIQYQNTVKIMQAKNLLRSDTMALNQISNYLGFNDVSYFCKFFKKHTNLTPKEYKNNVIKS